MPPDPGPGSASALNGPEPNRLRFPPQELLVRCGRLRHQSQDPVLPQDPVNSFYHGYLGRGLLVIAILGGKPFAHRLTSRLPAHQKDLTHGESCNQDDSQEGAGPQSGRIESRTN
ncbi:hypothetical protein [Microvirga yunnanensis]|uniref:hypothetical protein n=1 Tax=Microvirga yunnanensis TaxID=2953740 RepID=UPI0021C6E590|nr:hypothetical protein [Microvirga sp. HBU65207]